MRWVLVLALSVVAPLVVAIDNAMRIRRLNEAESTDDSSVVTADSVGR